jgi:hypothetical protein
MDDSRASNPSPRRWGVRLANQCPNCGHALVGHLEGNGCASRTCDCTLRGRLFSADAPSEVVSSEIEKLADRSDKSTVLSRQGTSEDRTRPTRETGGG